MQPKWVPEGEKNAGNGRRRPGISAPTPSAVAATGEKSGRCQFQTRAATDQSTAAKTDPPKNRTRRRLRLWVTSRCQAKIRTQAVLKAAICHENSLSMNGPSKKSPDLAMSENHVRGNGEKSLQGRDCGKEGAAKLNQRQKDRNEWRFPRPTSRQRLGHRFRIRAFWMHRRGIIWPGAIAMLK